MSRPFFKRPSLWLIVALILVPINIASVLWNPSLPAILALCINIAVVSAPLWWRPRP